MKTRVTVMIVLLTSPVLAAGSACGQETMSVFAEDEHSISLDEFIIYHHEWHLGSAELGPYGRYHLNELSKLLPKVPFNVVIRPSQNALRDRLRRAEVVRQLQARGVIDAEARTILKKIEFSHEEWAKGR